MKKLFKFVCEIGLWVISIYKIVSKKNKELIKVEDSRDKMKCQYDMLFRWMENNQNNKKITEYFLLRQINKVVIYGNGTLGMLLLNEIKNSSDVDVLYIVDKNVSNSKNTQVPVIGLEDIEKINEAEVVIVTPISYYDEIEQDLLDAGLTIDIVSLEDIIYVL